MELHGILKELYEQLTAVNDAIQVFERIARRRFSSLRARAPNTMTKPPNETRRVDSPAAVDRQGV